MSVVDSLLERVKLSLLYNGNGIVENFKNNSLFGSNTGTQPQTSFANSNLTINAFNYNGATANYLASEIAFFSMSTSLTDAESLALYNAVQLFNTTLERQV